MPDATSTEQFERRLVELGCPGRRLREEVRELGDHYADLREAALAEGCSESEAGTRAATQLGDPVMLAEDLVLGLRQASWWGRHPVIGFCLLPLPAFILTWLGGFFGLVQLCGLLGWLFGPAYDLDDASRTALQGNPAAFFGLVTPVKAGLDVAVCLWLTLGFWRLARRSAVGWKWAVAACGACLLASQLFKSSIQPHNLSVYLALWWHYPSWPCVIPLAAGVAAYVSQRRMENRLPPIPPGLNRARPAAAARLGLLHRWYVTPTYWVVTILTGLTLSLVIEWAAAAAPQAGPKAAMHQHHNQQN